MSRPVGAASPVLKSETEAWGAVKRYALAFYAGELDDWKAKRLADNIVAIANHMLARLGRGEHQNPSLVVFGNPRGQVLSRKTYSIKYRHAEDGEDYVHAFKSPVVMTLETEGGKRVIRLAGKNGQPLWGSDGEIADGKFDR